MPAEDRFPFIVAAVIGAPEELIGFEVLFPLSASPDFTIAEDVGNESLMKPLAINDDDVDRLSFPASKWPGRMGTEEDGVECLLIECRSKGILDSWILSPISSSSVETPDRGFSMTFTGSTLDMA